MAEAHPRVSVEHLRSIAEFAGLDLPEERLSLLVPQIQALIDGVAALDQLDLSEVEPEIVFRARWEDDDGS